MPRPPSLPSRRAWSRLGAVAAVTAATATVGCVDPAPGLAPRAGGDTTIDNRTSNAFSFPAPNLTAAELARHLDGDVAFEAVFVSPPATINAGLGPVYNNAGCARCHIRDGRGLAVAGGGPLRSPLLVRVSLASGQPEVPGGPVPVPGLGTQLQDHAIVGATPEATVEIRWIEEPGRYGDGEPYTLRRPDLAITLADGTSLPGDVLTSARIPPPVFGLGLLEAIPAATLEALADPDDRDGDGISGRVAVVHHPELGAPAVGRFGWKAAAPTLRQQAAGAYAEDMGVTSPLRPGVAGDVELALPTLDAATFYTQTLAVPARIGWDDPIVRRGEARFRDLGCAACHVEELRTGPHELPALAEQTIHPYTDLLLHNVGFGLADGRPEHGASGTEWRTPPLWGLGLTQTVLPGATYLHDGRARTLEEAILWHGGEAERSREGFRMLRASHRDELLAFLRSL